MVCEQQLQRSSLVLRKLEGSTLTIARALVQAKKKLADLEIVLDQSNKGDDEAATSADVLEQAQSDKEKVEQEIAALVLRSESGNLNQLQVIVQEVRNTTITCNTNDSCVVLRLAACTRVLAHSTTILVVLLLNCAFISQCTGATTRLEAKNHRLYRRCTLATSINSASAIQRNGWGYMHHY
jgi:hypothetical protein